jgi:hypothetical protein
MTDLMPRIGPKEQRRTPLAGAKPHGQAETRIFGLDGVEWLMLLGGVLLAACAALLF